MLCEEMPWWTRKVLVCWAYVLHKAWHARNNISSCTWSTRCLSAGGTARSCITCSLSTRSTGRGDWNNTSNKYSFLENFKVMELNYFYLKDYNSVKSRYLLTNKFTWCLCATVCWNPISSCCLGTRLISRCNRPHETWAKSHTHRHSWPWHPHHRGRTLTYIDLHSLRLTLSCKSENFIGQQITQTIK